MRKADLISSATVTAFGLFLLLYIIPGYVQKHAEGGYGLGARVMPDAMAILVVALGAMLFVARLVQPKVVDEVEGSEPPFTPANAVFLLRASLFLAAVTALFTWVGFLVAGPVTIGGFMVAMGERRPIPIVLTSIIAALAIWLFFWKLLEFPLP